MPRKILNPQPDIPVCVRLSPFHTDILRGFCAAWSCEESTTIAALLHSAYNTLSSDKTFNSPLHKTLKTIIAKVKTQDVYRKARLGNPDVYMERG